MSTGSDVALRRDPLISSPAFGDGSNVIELVGKGDIIDGTGRVQDGFAYVTHRLSGEPGWMSVLYLTPSKAQSDVMVDIDYVPPAQPGPEEKTDVTPVIAKEEAPRSSSGAAVVIGLLVLVAVGYGLAK